MADDLKGEEGLEKDQLADALADLFSNVTAMVRGELQVYLSLMST